MIFPSVPGLVFLENPVTILTLEGKHSLLFGNLPKFVLSFLL